MFAPPATDPILCFAPPASLLPQVTVLIRSVGIKNFRSCEDVEVEVDELTAIVGANGCGKSAVLHALELFYAVNPRFSPDDFYAHDTSKDIRITVTFAELTEEEWRRFKRYLQGDTLTVTHVLYWRDGRGSHSLHGERLRFDGFEEIRKQKASQAKQLYSNLPQVLTEELPPWSNQADTMAALDAWEDAHPELCARMQDDGSFFGFKEVGQGYLGRSTRLICIPAVRDAAIDAQDGKGSAIAELMDVIVRRTIAEHTDYRALVEDTQKRYREVFDAENFAEMDSLGGKLTGTLKTYVPAAKVELAWDASELDLPLPRASVRLAEDGFVTSVAACGHGLQRAFILTLLQHLAAARPGLEADVPAESNLGGGTEEQSATEPIPDLVLLIEEPELFQHPSRQRHFAEILKQLAGERIPGVAQRAQVIYCTHSPYFVGMDRFDQIRLFRKGVGESGSPKVTRVYQSGFDDIVERIKTADGDTGNSLTSEKLKSRLSALITPNTSEGFFADVAVLVEGESDRAALLGAAESLDIRLEATGIAIIPCSGKSNVLNIAAVYQAFGIATYCVWDGDSDKEPTAGICSACERPLDRQPAPIENHRLLRLHGATPVDSPPLQIAGRFACFETDLETTIRSEIGGTLFDEVLDSVKEDYGLSKRKQAMKNPWVLAEVLRRLRFDEHVAVSIEDIVRRILALASSPDGELSGFQPSPVTAPEHVPAVQDRGFGSDALQREVDSV